MKKTILSLIAAILLCTMCVGFVACTKDNAISLQQYAIENTFSFGHFLLLENGELQLQEDAFLCQIANNLGKMCRQYIEDNVLDAEELIYTYSEIGELSKIQDLCEHTRTNKGIFQSSTKYSFADVGYIDSAEIGKMSQDGDDYLLKKEQRGDIVIADILFVENKIVDNNGVKSGYNKICFGKYIYNKHETRLTTLTVSMEFVWNKEIVQEPTIVVYAIPWLLNTMNIEQIYELGKDYFEVMEEVVNAWLNDPRGQAHLNKYYNR